MTYLIFDEDEELLDVLNFESKEELLLYKSKNPTHIVRDEDDLLFIEDEDDIYNSNGDVYVDTEEFGDEW